MASDDLVQALREVVRRGAADDVGRVRGLLADLLPGMPALTRVAVAAVQEGVPADLRRMGVGGSTALAIARGVDRLVDQHGYKRALASRVVRAWAAVIGTSTDTSESNGSVADAYTMIGFEPSPLRNSYFDGLRDGATDASVKVSDHYPSAAPFFVSRAFLHNQPGWKPDPTGKGAGTYTQSRIVSGQQWMDNAREAHAGGQGWLSSFKDPTGVQDARSATYANDLGTKKGITLLLVF